MDGDLQGQDNWFVKLRMRQNSRPQWSRVKTDYLRVKCILLAYLLGHGIQCKEICEVFIFVENLLVVLVRSWNRDVNSWIAHFDACFFN